MCGPTRGLGVYLKMMVDGVGGGGKTLNLKGYKKKDLARFPGIQQRATRAGTRSMRTMDERKGGRGILLVRGDEEARENSNFHRKLELCGLYRKEKSKRHAFGKSVF